MRAEDIFCRTGNIFAFELLRVKVFSPSPNKRSDTYTDTLTITKGGYNDGKS